MEKSLWWTMLKRIPHKKRGLIMIDKNILIPIMKTLDKVILGINDVEEAKPVDARKQFIEIDTEEEFDVERSMN
jgi:hypothetical protein